DHFASEPVPISSNPDQGRWSRVAAPGEGNRSSNLSAARDADQLGRGSVRGRLARALCDALHGRFLRGCDAAAIEATARADRPGLCAREPRSAADASWQASRGDARARSGCERGRGSAGDPVVAAAVAAVWCQICAPAANGGNDWLTAACGPDTLGG